jgi:Tfp pilus assembly protein PilF
VTSAAEPKATAAESSTFREAVKLYESGCYAEAEAFLAKALQEMPQDRYLWNARGVNLRVMRRQAEAVWCFRHALAIDDRCAAVWSNLGDTLKDLKHTHSAIACHLRAAALAPDDAAAQDNLGIALTVADRHVEALAAFDRALELHPNNHKARLDRARSYFHLGDYARGRADYEARLVTGHLPKRQFPGTRWNGERYEGKRLLVISEHGMGDAIWVARYLRRVKALGGELVMECRPETIPLIASLRVCDHLVPKRDPLPNAAFHINQCSLPGLYTPNLRDTEGALLRRRPIPPPEIRRGDGGSAPPVIATENKEASKEKIKLSSSLA